MSEGKLKKHWPAYLLGVVVTFIFLCALVTFQVSESEFGLLIHQGKPVEEIYQPGLHFKWPAPIDQKWTIDKRIHTYKGDSGSLDQVYTSDGQQVITSIFISWRVKDPMRFYENFKAETSADSIKGAKSQLNSYMKEQKIAVVKNYKFDQIFSPQSKAITLAEISNKIQGKIQESVAGLGIEVVDTGVNSIGFSEDTSTKVFERMRASNSNKETAITSEGEEIANDITSKANSDANALIKNAESEALVERSKADAAAAEFYKVYAQSPELAKLLKNYEILEAQTRKRTTWITTNKFLSPQSAKKTTEKK